MPYKLEDQFCKFMEKDEFIYPELKLASNFPDVGVCPWPTGNV